jgi:hypothetical protein
MMKIKVIFRRANKWMIFVYIQEYNEPDYLSEYFI